MSEDKKDRDLAVETLRQICLDLDAPKQARASAARTLLELSGDIGKLQNENKINQTKPLSELTKQELDQELAKYARPAPLDSPSSKSVRRLNDRAKQTKLKALRTKREARQARKQYDI
jgi:hypothetical protein